jgi:hypothetical protein
MDQEREPQQPTQDPAEIDNLEVTELDDKDIEEVSGGLWDNNNCGCSQT